MSAKAASWLSRPIGFAPVEERVPVRMHWYADGSNVSACGNYPRPFMSYARHPNQAACPRCVDALRWAGESVPLMPGADDLEEVVGAP